jgi:general stress protein 26
MLLHRRANRQYVPIPDDELWSFIDSRDKVYVAFPMKNGYPHVSPMWFCVLDRKIFMRTQDYKVKAKLATEGKVCFTLDDGKGYRDLRGAVVWGRSRVVSEKALVDRIEKMMRTKYMEQQWRSSEMPSWWVAERKAEHRAYIEVVPLRVSSWDNRRIR